jgi:PAS domain S-box-containing protein
MLSVLGGPLVAWLAVGLAAVLGLLGIFSNFDWASSLPIRAIALSLLSLILLSFTGSTGSFFFLWFFVLVAFYPIILKRPYSYLIPVGLALAYLSIGLALPTEIPLPVVIARMILVLFIGLLTAATGNLIFSFANERSRLFQRASDGMVIVDLSNQILETNERFAQMLGHDVSDIVGQNIDSFYAAGGSRPEPMLDEFRTGKSVLLERRLKTNYGTTVAIEVHSNLLGGDRILGIVRDVTERESIRAALAESEEKFSGAFNASPALVAITTPDGKLAEINQAFLAFLGASRQAAVGRDVVDLGIVSKKDMLKAQAIIEEQGGFVQNLEVSGQLPDGREYTGLLSAQPLVLGGVSHQLTMLLDITEQKQNETRFRDLLESTPDAIIVVDEAGTISSVNNQAEVQFGYTRAELSGKRLEMLLPERFRGAHPELREAYTATATARPMGLDQELAARRKDGSEYPVDISLSPLKTSGSTTVIAAIRDITKYKAVEQALQQNQRILNTMLEFSRRLSAELDLDLLLKSIVEGIVAAFPKAEAASIWLYDPDQDRVQPRAWAGHPDQVFRDVSVEPDTSLIGQIFRTGQPLLSSDATAEPSFEYLGQSELDRLHSIIGAPLSIDGQVVGAIFGDNLSEKDVFGKGDLDLLLGLALQAEVAIKNGRLYAQVQVAELQLRNLSHRLVEVHETERRTIGRELHDQLGQMMTALSLTLETASRLPAAKQAEKYEYASQIADDLLQRISRLSLELRPPMLDDLGLVPAVLWHITHFQEPSELEIDFRHSGIERTRLAPEIEINAYRVIQEALTNIARHAKAKQVQVSARVIDEVLTIKIKDDGRGFDPLEHRILTTSSGLSGMRERARLNGGMLSIDSEPHEGTLIVLQLPLQENSL